MIKRCSECRYFRIFYVRDNKVYIATIYGLCRKRKRTCSNNYYCNNHKDKEEAKNET